jgi:uncharacterized DUF497 family protein
MKLIFERDAKKAASNLRKHKVGFDEAETIFGDPYEVMIPGPRSQRGRGKKHIGESAAGRILTVVYTQIGEVIRLISAWPAEDDEVNDYLERRGG